MAAMHASTVHTFLATPWAAGEQSEQRSFPLPGPSEPSVAAPQSTHAPL
jgi:hypothetical protein